MMAELPSGASIHYRIDGPDLSPVVMLAHGVALDLRLWDPLVEELARDFRVLRYDSRGHGLSPAGSTPLTLASLGNDAIALLDVLRISRVHYVGLSLGGMVGMGLALEHSKRLQSVSFCNARGDAPPEYRSNWDERVTKVRKGGMVAIADATVRRWFTPQFPDKNPETVLRIKEMVLATSVEGYCASAEALKGLDYAQRLTENRVRALFLAGADDAGAPPDVVRALQQTTPNSQYLELPDTGHISVTENPGGFYEAITRFIRAD